MRLGGPAQLIAEVTTRDELAQVVSAATQRNLPYFVLGGGSNVIARDEGFAGVIVLNRIPGFEVLDDKDGATTLRIGAGENWDATVARTVEMGLSGIEAMSAIPGTVGATPVQNVGAYGQEIADTLVELEAYDTKTSTFIKLSNQDCAFSYRNSIFKSTANRRYIIINITIKLSHTTPQPPFYAALQTYLDAKGITYYTPQVIRDAVVDIRREKLPNPAIYPNTGSFFKNRVM